jgi:hypothetical protein
MNNSQSIVFKGVAGLLLIDTNSIINYLVTYSNQITVLLNLIIAVITIYKLFKKKRKEHGHKKYY